MELTTLLITIGVVIAILVLISFALSKQYKKVGPNEVLIVSGGRKRTIIDGDGVSHKVGYRIHIGGGTFVLPFIESAQILPLETYTVTIRTPEVLTRKGVHIIAEAFAQVKVASTASFIRRAAEQFLNRGSQAIREVTGHILEGYIRNAIGSLTVEEIYQNRDSFSNRVRTDAQPDIALMGLELLSFNLGDISDSQGYIDALGMPQISQVKRDAAIAKAETERDTTIKTAKARKEGDVVRYQVETEIARASRDFELQKSEFQVDINKRKAAADIAYDLERNKLAAELKKAEYETKFVEKHQAIKVEEQEIKRRSLELQSSVLEPAEARKHQIQAEADAEKYRIAAEAEGRAEARNAEGKAEVAIKKAEGINRIEYIRNSGLAEAEAMHAKAEAYKNYNEIALYEMMIEKMPELAKHISEPLSRIEKIVMVGDGVSGATKLTGIVTDVMAQITTAFKALSGKDLIEIISGNGDEKKDIPKPRVEQ